MNIRNSIIFIIFMVVLALTSLAFMSASAHAKVATWSQEGNWTVYGDSDSQSCSTTTSYETGYMMHILFVDGETSLAFSGLSVIPGTKYEVQVIASSGSKGVMPASAINSDTVLFQGINDAAIVALVESESIYIQGLGKFSLKGSRQAMKAAWECYETLNSF